MKSQQVIITELKNICNSSGYTGEVVDMLINLCAYSIYNRNQIAYILGNESNPDTAVNLNSIIKHALVNLYSIPRGRNCELMISATRLKDVRLEPFQVLYSYQNYKLVAVSTEQELNPEVGKETLIRCIITPTIYLNAVPSDSLNQMTHTLDFGEATDCCEQAYLLHNGIQIPTTSDLGVHFNTTRSAVSDTNIPLMLTGYNYSIRTHHNTKVRPSEYSLIAFKYTDYTPAYVTRSSVDGTSIYEAVNTDPFIRGLKINGFTINGCYVNPSTTRDSLIDVNYLSKYNLATCSQIRGTRDAERVFSERYKDQIIKSHIRVTTEGGYTKDGQDQQYCHNVVIHYVPKSKNGVLDEAEVLDYLNNSLFQGIPAKFTVRPAKMLEVQLSIKIHTGIMLELDSIRNYLKSNYDGTMNSKITTARMITEISRLDSNIDYSEVEMNLITNTSDIASGYVSSIDLTDKPEYYIMITSIDIEYGR